MGLLGPDKHSAYKKGLKKMDKGDFSGANREFERAITFYPEFADAWCDRGVAQQNLGNEEESMRC